MREYDLKKALSTGSYTRNSIKPQLLVAEDGEYRQGDILDANATMEVVNSTASDIDDKINDILGVDNGAVQELVGILSDSDTTTGILNELAKKANISDLETVAGDIPQVPTNVSAFTNDAGYLTQHQDISGKANSSDLSTVATSGSYNDLSNKPNLANVATSGSYEDLSNKPHIPEDPVQSDWTEDDTTDQAYIKNKPNLATVATTGDYTDLSNKPTIPTKLSDLLNDVHFASEGANGHDYVEIGGVKWATMNIGASSITDGGLYFLWGDTQGYTADLVGAEPKKPFVWNDYKYNSGVTKNITKYNDADNKRTLDFSDDAARVNWGGDWRVPTQEEWIALAEATTISWDDNYNGSGVSGYVLTDKTDNNKKLFFLATGWCDNGRIIIDQYANDSDDDHFAMFWGNSIYSHTPTQDYAGYENAKVYHFAWGVQNNGFIQGPLNQPRCQGLAIRAVLNELNTLNKVAITGDYNDLNNKPDLSTVATTGSYNDLTDKPTIPTKVSDLTNNLDFLQQPHSSNGHEYVEIGGIKWATENIGAAHENDPGLYFAWGETEGYRIYADDSQNTRDFSESEYKYAELDGSNYVYTKYNSTDGKSSLDLEDDAARANWGGNWRIPTRAEFYTLFINCIATIVRNSSDSPIGFLFTDKTDSTKSIYFPGCRGRKDGFLHDKNYYNSLPIWTSERYNLSDYNKDDIVWIIGASYETTNGIDTPGPATSGTAYRYSGRPIRAILDEPTPSNTASKVAITGDYNDLVNTPTIPTKLSDLTNDSDYTQLPQDNFFEGHEYVDLGLPSGTLWAKCNVGASSEVDYGAYFKYGLNQFVFSDPTYTGTENPLSSSADAATIRWGNSWCSPTETLYRELVDNTTPEICKINGVDGTKYTAANGKYIFFPHGGYGSTENASTILYRLLFGGYWTSTPCSISGRELSEAIAFKTGSAADGIGSVDRDYGHNIKPVISSSAQVTPVRFLREDGTWTNVVSETIRIINLTQNIADETTNISGTSNDGKRETVIYNNTSQNDYTVSISTAYKTVDGNQMVLSVPAGCYGEVCYTNIGGTIFAKGIKQLANS